MPRIGNSDLEVFGLGLGGNVFGQVSNEDTSLAVLDAYADGGGNFIDTADSYGLGDSESIIGKWLATRHIRDKVVLATKGGAHPDYKGLKPETIRGALENSLWRLGTDHIDLYYTHFDDPETPVDEIISTLDELVSSGWVRYVGASNITAKRLAESLAFSDREGLARYVVLQQQYNLVEREEYEGPLREVVEENGLSSAPSFGLAWGFLTGKYRPGVTVESIRAEQAGRYLETDRGRRVLAALDEVAGTHSTSQTSVALAWLAAQPTVVAPLASARTLEQVPSLLASVSLQLTAEELALLSAASA